MATPDPNLPLIRTAALGSVAALLSHFKRTAASAREPDELEQGFWRPTAERLLSPGAVLHTAQRGLIFRAANGQMRTLVCQILIIC